MCIWDGGVSTLQVPLIVWFNNVGNVSFVENIIELVTHVFGGNNQFLIAPFPVSHGIFLHRSMG
jgi:hypothetical protein